jgi:SAM-dependent methyltransferase
MNSASTRPIWNALVEDGHLAGTWHETRVRYGKAARYLLTLDRQRSVIDVGCGTGGCLEVLARLGFARLVGVEITEAHVRRARERCPTARYVIADGEALPFKNDSVDCVISAGAIEHYSDPRRGIAELCRIATQKLVITSDCYAWRILQLVGLYRSFMPVDRALWPPHFFRLLRAGGMDVEHFDAWGTTHYRRGLRKLARRLRLTSAAVNTTAPPIEASDSDAFAADRRSGRIGRWLRLFVMDENIFYSTKYHRDR